VEITNEILERVIAGKPVGEHEAYRNGSHNKIKGHIKATIHDLEQSRIIALETQDSYGSGYASYVDVFCYKKDRSSSQVKSGTTYIAGIGIYLCKLAPVAVMGSTGQSQSPNGGTFGFLRAEDLGTFPPGDWTKINTEIRQKLERYGIEILEPQELIKPLTFTAKIETNFGDPPYTIFDAFFHWMD
jgi:hypothetical protein